MKKQKLQIFLFMATILFQTYSISPMKKLFQKVKARWLAETNQLPSFQNACKNGKIEILKQMIKKSKNPTSNLEKILLRASNPQRKVNRRKDLAKYACKKLISFNKHPLINFTQKGNLDAIRYLIEEINIARTTKKNNNIFHTACLYKQYHIAHYLLEQSKRCNIFPLHNACKHKNEKIIDYFLEINNDEFFREDINGNTPLDILRKHKQISLARSIAIEFNAKQVNLLHHACKTGKLDTIKFFVEKLGIHNPDSFIENHSYLDLACLYEQNNVAQYFANKAKELNIHPLHKACMFGIFATIKYFLENNTLEFICEDINGNTPLDIACLYDKRNTVQYIVNELKNKGLYILHDACQREKLDTVKYLVENNIASLFTKNLDNKYPLDIARKYDKTSIIAYIIEKTNKTLNTDNNTPLDIEAVKYFEHEMKKLGICPLYEACKNGKLQIVNTLIEKLNYSPKEKYELDCTLLHIACSYGQLEIVRYFMETHNIPADIRNRAGETPLDIARASGKKDIADYIEALFYCENTNNYYECAIRYENFKEHDEIAVLPCNHMFYPEGIPKLKSKNCPICRRIFKDHEIQKKLFKKISIAKLENQNLTENELWEIGYSENEIESLGE